MRPINERRSRLRALAASVAVLVMGAAAPRVAPAAVAQPAAPHRAALAVGPAFERNEGQAGPGVRFVSRSPRGAVFVGADFLALGRRAGGVRLRLAGASPSAAAEGLAPLARRTSYLLGAERSRWRSQVAAYERVACRGVYPGVDVVYYWGDGLLEYDFVVAPGADPGRIALEVDGARSVRVDRGDLVIDTAAGEVRQRRPAIYQSIGGERRAVSGAFALDGASRVVLRTGAFDPAHPLVVDPVIVFSSYLGGSGRDAASAVAVGADGSAYVVGETDSLDFPTFGGAQPAGAGDVDLFVARLAPDGASLLYATYVGGSREDVATAVAVDAAGSAYVTGRTTSLDFPTTPGAFDLDNGRFPTCAGLDCVDSFVVKLSADGGSFAYATYLGGEHDDYATAIAVDASGAASITGSTNSFGFPRVNAFSPRKKQGAEAFVTRLNATGTAVHFSSYIGGNLGDGGFAVAVDADANTYVAGDTFSNDFTTAAPLQAASGGGLDVFVAKVTPEGSLVYATYLGGSGDDRARGIAVDDGGGVVVAGETRSADFPAVRPVQATLGGGSDAFVAKITSSGDALAFATYLGGSSDDAARGAAAAASGRLVVAGLTRSADFPVAAATQGACGSCAAPGFFSDAFVAEIDPGAPALVFSTFLGGRGDEYANGVALAPDGGTVVAGVTFSSDYPSTEGAVQPGCGCGPGTSASAFVARIATVDAAPHPPVVESVAASKRPFRLELTGRDFRPGARVFVGADVEPWPAVVVEDETSISVGGGKSLKRRFPKRIPVQLRVVNPDGGEATATFAR